MKAGDDRGSSTAELAMLLPVMALFLSLVLGLGVLGSHQIRVQQAASAVARELARGQSPAQAESSGIRLAGREATYHMGGTSEVATVRVTRNVQLPLVGTVVVHGEARVAVEQP
ncbi:pilus assembly protein [Glutamicibacter sp. MNS18]|uniref:TadE family type IV pilus minor pilin n=1 Tax=Glutamicibacter sp. MNS18 TaxID=2989817 RepID=UPI0022368BA1|nr:TadE family type IV pilus minor pilin [Glutamicibacter sp. MNS18]MCW4464011.1 pilus assembly protein [Glutamicibacter sp. MNS18]